ncbi:hypothetical protein QVD17_35234 [Tagetes erecta]|uniref:Uncharacterized protein n=1 Tax=Tagetes erecta TaxID=13708 RepID=A0AAD8NM71_TARER|nr:hypothetical protein QVD17_35234 [Tagetes erecta]
MDNGYDLKAEHQDSVLETVDVNWRRGLFLDLLFNHMYTGHHRFLDLGFKFTKNDIQSFTIIKFPIISNYAHWLYPYFFCVFLKRK